MQRKFNPKKNAEDRRKNRPYINRYGTPIKLSGGDVSRSRVEATERFVRRLQEAGILV